MSRLFKKIVFVRFFPDNHVVIIRDRNVHTRRIIILHTFFRGLRKDTSHSNLIRSISRCFHIRCLGKLPVVVVVVVVVVVIANISTVRDQSSRNDSRKVNWINFYSFSFVNIIQDIIFNSRTLKRRLAQLLDKNMRLRDQTVDISANVY